MQKTNKNILRLKWRKTRLEWVNANKHDDEAIHLSNEKFIKSRDELRILQWLLFFSSVKTWGILSSSRRSSWIDVSLKLRERKKKVRRRWETQRARDSRDGKAGSMNISWGLLFISFFHPMNSQKREEKLRKDKYLNLYFGDVFLVSHRRIISKVLSLFLWHWKSCMTYLKIVPSDHSDPIYVS